MIDKVDESGTHFIQSAMSVFLERQSRWVTTGDANKTRHREKIPQRRMLVFNWTFEVNLPRHLYIQYLFDPLWRIYAPVLLDSVNLQGTDWSRGDSSSNCIELALLTLYNHNNKSKGTVNVGCNYYAFRRDLSISLEGELRMQISSALCWCCSARPTLADTLFIDSSDTWLARLYYKIANLLTNVLPSFYLAINLFTTFFFLDCGPPFCAQFPLTSHVTNERDGELICTLALSPTSSWWI